MSSYRATTACLFAHKQQHYRSLPRRVHGFTLVELITVIVIVGILAVFAAPRFFGSSSYELRIAQDLIISSARRAQQLAMHLGPAANVQLLTDNASKQVRINYVESGIGKSLSQPLPDGITVNNITVSYSTLGSATPATTITLTATGSRKVCIEDTGYAHACN